MSFGKCILFITTYNIQHEKKKKRTEKQRRENIVIKNSKASYLFPLISGREQANPLCLFLQNQLLLLYIHADILLLLLFSSMNIIKNPKIKTVNLSVKVRWYPSSSSLSINITVHEEECRREVMRLTKACSSHGIVRAPMGWLNPNSSSAHLSKSLKQGWFR